MRIAEHSVPCSAFGAHLAHKITTPSGRLIGRPAQQYGLIV